MGFGPRSHRGAAYIVSDIAWRWSSPIQVSTISTRPSAPLPLGDVIYYPAAFAEAALGAIEERVSIEHRIAIDHEDATKLAANAVPLNGSIVMSKLFGTAEEEA
jgi:hypothetical protein